MQIKFKTCGLKSAFKDAIGYGMLNVPIPQDRGEDPFLPSAYGNVTAICLLGRNSSHRSIVLCRDFGKIRQWTQHISSRESIDPRLNITQTPSATLIRLLHGTALCMHGTALCSSTTFCMLAVQRSSVLILTFPNARACTPEG